MGPAADIYALTCPLHQLLVGRTPFIASRDRSLVWHHVNTAPPAVRSLRPDVPAEVERLLLRMLHKDSEQRVGAATVYETLLPLAAVGAPAGTPRLLTADGLELDPCTPFTRPFGGSVRRELGRAVMYTPTVPDVVATSPSPSGPVPLTDAEADEATERAGELAQQKQFTQASDVLVAALNRAGEGMLAEDLSLSLAHVKFLAGAHREALSLFEQAAEAIGARFGPDDHETLQCRYYAAECLVELGETTAALAAFKVYTEHAPDDDDPLSVDRHLAGLAHIMRLEAGAEHYSRARNAARELVDATLRYRGTDTTALTGIEDFVKRLNRFEGA
ncbi:tetratricopeptide repeat protein [Streptomyces atroolivaceus]|uniref:tetratricopeptide repeat protein n=1 Tax=Streptomyces atroolivaceus TaxID=66869 RepID=UPI00364A21DC